MCLLSSIFLDVLHADADALHPNPNADNQTPDERWILLISVVADSTECDLNFFLLQSINNRIYHLINRSIK